MREMITSHSSFFKTNLTSGGWSGMSKRGKNLWLGRYPSAWNNHWMNWIWRFGERSLHHRSYLALALFFLCVSNVLQQIKWCWHIAPSYSTRRRASRKAKLDHLVKLSHICCMPEAKGTYACCGWLKVKDLLGLCTYLEEITLRH